MDEQIQRRECRMRYAESNKDTETYLALLTHVCSYIHYKIGKQSTKMKERQMIVRMFHNDQSSLKIQYAYQTGFR